MRFKELRGLFLGMLLVMLDVGVFVFALLDQNKIKLIAALILTAVILMNLLTQFYIRVLNDCVFCYRFIGIALLPKIVEFKDIVQTKLAGKHHLVLETAQGSTHIYVWHAKKLETIILKNKEGLIHEKN